MSYTVVAMYTGFDYDRDESIERAARRKADGSGFGFGERDLSFTFVTKRGADNAVKRIHKVGKGIRSYSYKQEN